jgi:hypothetical protein
MRRFQVSAEEMSCKQMDQLDWELIMQSTRQRQHINE